MTRITIPTDSVAVTLTFEDVNFLRDAVVTRQQRIKEMIAIYGGDDHEGPRKVYETELAQADKLALQLTGLGAALLAK